MCRLFYLQIMTEQPTMDICIMALPYHADQGDA